MSLSYSKQRVFARSESNNYNDYLKMKNGETLLKNYKKDVCLNRFLNYNDFLIMTKSYYNHLHSNECNVQLQTNMYETNQSFIRYQALKNHVNSCNYCLKLQKNNTLAPSFDNIQCYQLLNILYPYGVYEDICKPIIYFPNKLNLKDWCLQKKRRNCLKEENFIDTLIVNDFSSNDKNNKKTTSCGLKYKLCNNTKPLFI